MPQRTPSLKRILMSPSSPSSMRATATTTASATRGSRRGIHHKSLLSILGLCIVVVTLSIYRHHGKIGIGVFNSQSLDEASIVLGVVFDQSTQVAQPTGPDETTLADGSRKVDSAAESEEALVLTDEEKLARALNAQHERDIHAKEIMALRQAKAMTGQSPASIPKHHNECGNSEEWLNMPRYGNLDDDPVFSDEIMQNMLLNLDQLLVPHQDQSTSSLSNLLPMKGLLQHTICHKDSRFLNITTTIPNPDALTIRNWAVKLIYLALHYHQHRLAAPEARNRYDPSKPTCKPSALSHRHQVGGFDYECPGAKYLVMPLCGNGLGANVRAGMVVAMLMGLITDRQVLFLNKVDSENEYLASPWHLASCDRQDYQCFFMPPSPCSLTHEEIRNAHVLNRKEYRRLMRRNRKADAIQHHKVWLFESNFMPVEYMPQHAVARLYGYMDKMINAVPQNKYPEYVDLLRKAAKSIFDDTRRDGYNYAAANIKISHAFTFYFMRPNPHSAEKLDRVMRDIVPDSIQPELSVGLPIRASDKCEGESECLTFDQHMQVVNNMWERHVNRTEISANPQVVFTTESKSMMAEQQLWVGQKMGSKYSYQFDFVTNSKDVLPDTGFVKHHKNLARRKRDHSHSADDIMLSSMSSLKFQLLPRISIGNCCSNFHVMLNDFLSEGCGAASENTFLCLQEYEDPLLRVCCGWHKECKAAKQKLLAEMANRRRRLKQST